MDYNNINRFLLSIGMTSILGIVGAIIALPR